MPIKNYRTIINANKTVGEIQSILSAKTIKAKSISVEYFDGQPDAVRFVISIYKQEFAFRLPCNPHGVLATMERDGVAKTYCNLDHARNISWRIIKDWVDAQVAIIDSGQAKPAEVFFPYLLEKSGETLYQKFEYQQLQLTSGD